MAKKRHLYEVDLMRALIMLGVLSVHTLARYIEIEPAYGTHTLTKPLVAMGAVISSLHFTRESFMFITGLVLFITYYHKTFHPWQFWYKRLTLIAVPYVVWNIIYILFGKLHRPSAQWSITGLLHQFFHALISGNQMYLYYVLVSLQLYVVFPLLLYGLRKTERWHWHIFVGSLAVELFFMYMNKFVLAHMPASSFPGFFSTLDANRGTFILTYEFWFVAGGIIACHYDKIHAYMKKHQRTIWITFGTAVVVLYAHYFLDQLVLREGPSLSQTVFQPIMVPYSFIITAVIWFAGVKWSERRERPRWQPFSRLVKVAADTSFGIFLIQPFPLFVMEWTVKRMQVPAWLHYSLIPVSVLFVYFSSMLVAYIFSKTPYLANCIGRKATWKQTKGAGTSTVAS